MSCRYIAEALHAPVYPLGFVTFADSWDAASAAPWTSVIGCDYGYDGLWLWNKITKAEHLPAAYRDALATADRCVLVRSTDTDTISGMCDGAYLHTSFGKFAEKTREDGSPVYPSVHRLWQESAARRVTLSRDEAAAANTVMRQWEWGVPDETVAMLAQYWRDLGKRDDDFVVVEGGTVALFEATPRLWVQYLMHNSFVPRGFTFSGCVLCGSELRGRLRHRFVSCAGTGWRIPALSAT